MPVPYRALAVCGPTASGKSALGVQLARSLSGEILNVDSVQVYRHLDIGSAKLTESERGGISHHLLDIFEPDRPANVAQFREQALASLRDVSARAKLPILVGGSGMYLTVLLHGLADVPATTEDVRRSVSALSPDEQYAELSVGDPESAARLNRNDTQRVSRAVEILRMTGRKPSDLLAEHRFAERDVIALVIVLCRPRDELYRRIDQRSTIMVRSGLIEETRKVLDRYGDVPALNTLGYAQARDYLHGKILESDLEKEIALHTRRFAKRQMTYWRNEPLKRGWAIRPTDSEVAEEVEGFEIFPQRAQKRMKGFRAFRYSEEQLREAVRVRLLVPMTCSEVWFVQMHESPS
jgi:tRNA dimethylallyltransferase